MRCSGGNGPEWATRSLGTSPTRRRDSAPVYAYPQHVRDTVGVSILQGVLSSAVYLPSLDSCFHGSLLAK
jgi:hypothetical protein